MRSGVLVFLRLLPISWEEVFGELVMVEFLSPGFLRMQEAIDFLLGRDDEFR